jgi:hypothetical protein
MAFSAARSQCGVTYDASELADLSSQSDIQHELFQLDAQKLLNDANFTHLHFWMR